MTTDNYFDFDHETDDENDIPYNVFDFPTDQYAGTAGCDLPAPSPEWSRTNRPSNSNGISQRGMAVAIGAATTTPARKPTFSPEEDMTSFDLDTIEPRDLLHERLSLGRGELTILCGVGDSGKSLTAIELLTCAASGRSFLGFPFIPRQDKKSMRVLHIDNEQNERMCKRRISRISNGLGLKIDELTGYKRRKLEGRWNGTNAQLNEMREGMVEAFTGFDMVLIDSLKKLHNVNENNGETEPLVDMLRLVAEETNACILLIHHKGKGPGTAVQTGRGSTTTYDSIDGQIDTSRDRKTKICQLVSQKSRDGEAFDDVMFRYDDTGEYNKAHRKSVGLTFALVKEEPAAVKEVATRRHYLTAINNHGPLNNGTLFRRIGGDRGQFNSRRDQYVAEGFLSLTPKGNADIYSITDAGKEWLAALDHKEAEETA
jgi:hypothetical protein